MEIALKGGAIALIDDADYPLVSGRSWLLRKTSCAGLLYAYAHLPRAGGRQRIVLMHRLILPQVYGMVTDHINGNGLDNRRANLRICTQAENCRNSRKSKNNTVGFKGVFRRGAKFRAAIFVDGATIVLGRFSSPVEAARAYDSAAEKHYGEFAATNRRLGLLPGEIA